MAAFPLGFNSLSLFFELRTVSPVSHLDGIRDVYKALFQLWLSHLVQQSKSIWISGLNVFRGISVCKPGPSLGSSHHFATQTSMAGSAQT